MRRVSVVAMAVAAFALVSVGWVAATPTAGAVTGGGCTLRQSPNSTEGTAYYCRAGVYQYPMDANGVSNADGAYMSTQVQSPWVTTGNYPVTGDYHSLAELAVQDRNQQQLLEIGWRVSPYAYGDQTPRLFVTHWIDQHFICYSNPANPCDFVSTSSSIKPEMVLNSATTAQFEIDYSGGDWWFGLNGTWFGYFPGSLWNNTFTKAGLVQMFGEVSSTQSIPCTNMGNGYLGTSPASVAVNNIGYFNTTDTVNLTVLEDDANLYNSQVTTTNDSFRYGGSGGRGTTACTTTS